RARAGPAALAQPGKVLGIGGPERTAFAQGSAAGTASPVDRPPPENPLAQTADKIMRKPVGASSSCAGLARQGSKTRLRAERTTDYSFFSSVGGMTLTGSIGNGGGRSRTHGALSRQGSR